MVKAVREPCVFFARERTFVALVANISLFFFSTKPNQAFTVDVATELQPVEFQPECCARVMLTRALRIEALLVRLLTRPSAKFSTG